VNTVESSSNLENPTVEEKLSAAGAQKRDQKVITAGGNKTLNPGEEKKIRNEADWGIIKKDGHIIESERTIRGN